MVRFNLLFAQLKTNLRLPFCVSNHKIILILWFVPLFLACNPGGELLPLAQPQVNTSAYDQTIELSWSPVESAEQYHIYQSDSEEISKLDIKPVKTSETRLLLSGLENNKIYFFAVTTIGNSGESDIKQIVTAIPRAAPPPPTNIKAKPGSESITVSWDPIAGAETYTLYMSRTPGISKENIKNLSGWMIQEEIISPYTQTGLFNGETYYFTVTAKSQSGESIISEEFASVPRLSLKIAMGYNHICSILVDHSLWCWGINNYGQLGDGSFISKSTPVKVIGNEQWKDITLGPGHTCAITTNDKSYCWGLNNFNRIGASYPEKVNTPVELIQGDHSWISLSVGLDISCGIKQNQVENFECWGNPEHLPSFENANTTDPILENLEWLSIKSSQSHYCATRSDGSLWCWGENNVGQLGNGEFSNSTIGFQQFLSRVESTESWKTISINSHIDYPTESISCALNENDNLWCWGADKHNIQHNKFVGLNTEFPFEIATDSTWRTVATGRKHACAIRSDSTLWCLGKSPHGQWGTINTFSIVPVTQVGNDADWIDIIANDENTCASKTDGSIWCSGRNQYGQLGVSQSGFIKEPVEVFAGVSEFSINSSHVCLIDLESELWCWGNNDKHQIGNGSQENMQSPVKLLGSVSNNLSASNTNSCIVSAMNDIVCWGYFEFHDEKSLQSPRNLNNAHEWRRVATGINNRCAIRFDNTLWCYKDFLDIEPYDITPSPSLYRYSDLAQIGVNNNWDSISFKDNHACALNMDQEIWCWGLNEFGQLGTEDETNYGSPQRIAENNSWHSVKVSKNHSCAIRSDDSLWCWGNNEFGKLGLGNLSHSNTVIEVESELGWLSVELANDRTCGVKLDNSLWCWGLAFPTSNDISNETLATITSPQQVGDQKIWELVGMGDRFICATDSNKTLFCWGDNSEGLLGNGHAWSTTWQKVKFPYSRVVLK